MKAIHRALNFQFISFEIILDNYNILCNNINGCRCAVLPKRKGVRMVIDITINIVISVAISITFVVTLVAYNG
jgi:hypothetical protein